MLKIIEYVLLDQPSLPMFPSPTTYLLASNGVFVWARREGMEALVPVTSKITHAIRGLYPATPYVRLAYPLVDQHIMQDLFMQACAACLDSKGAQEKLFYLNWKPEAGWQLTVPPQQTESARVTPLIGEAHRLLYANTLLEIHSHQHFAPWFSATDNADEQGCRIYGVVGHLLGALPPEIRLRIGIYGHFWDIPAHWIVQLPEGMKDSTWEAWSRSLPDWGGVAV